MDLVSMFILVIFIFMIFRKKLFSNQNDIIDREPAYPLKDLVYLKGGPIEDYEADKVYVVEFWATWCPPCRTSIPHLSKIQVKYQDQGLIVVGISTEGEDTINQFLKEKKNPQFGYTVATTKQGDSKFNRSYMTKYNVGGIPHAFLVDKNGNVAWHGHPMDEAFEKKIEELINENPDEGVTEGEETAGETGGETAGETGEGEEYEEDEEEDEDEDKDPEEKKDQ